MRSAPSPVFRRQLIISFGSLILGAMFLFAAVTLVLDSRTQRLEEEKISGSLASTIAEAISRVSFSGKYQTRLLTQEMLTQVPALAYISVDGLDGQILAHSDPTLIETPLGDPENQFDRQSLDQGKAVFRDLVRPNGRHFKEVAVPYRGGLENQILGVVRIGMDLAEVRQQETTVLLTLCFFGLFLTTLTLLLIVKLGTYFGKQLSNLANQLEGILENSPIGMAIYTPQGLVTRYNRKFTELFGYTVEELPRVQDWFQRAYPNPDYRQEIEAQWNQKLTRYLGGEGPFIPMETHVMCKDGTSKDIEFMFEAIGETHITTFTNQTERNKAEDERLTIERQMLHVQKLESLGVMASGMAHDFNNILMAIMGHADLARMKIYQGDSCLDSLNEIVLASRRASDLSKQMLAYAGRGKFQIELTQTSTLIQEISQLLGASVSKRAILRLELPSDLPPVLADTTQLRQVVMNLIMNASEALGDKPGEIALTTGLATYTREDLDTFVLGPEIPPGKYLFIKVQDNGCGMTGETLKRIFEPFFTTKFTGRGLGMAAVLGIIRGHRGAIGITSTPGIGSEFRVILPPSEEKPYPQQKQDTQRSTWTASGTALVIDDEATVLRIASKMLESLGFKVLTADGADQALSLFQTYQDSVSLVLIDLIMPGKDGAQIMEALRQVNPGLKIILYSGLTLEEVQSRYPAAKASAFMQKPFDTAQLRDVLQKLFP